MQTIVRRLGGLALIVALMLGTVSPAGAAHNGNSKANIAGDGGVHGQAVVNYSEGTGTFHGRITVSHLTPGETYTFAVERPGPRTEICSGEANAGGTFTCSAQGLTLPGFSDVVVTDSSGETVASGTLVRRGNCRDPQQGGSQCMAPGLTNH
jgi:hypothetical protein